MIKLAFEIPTSCLPRFSKMTNYDFALTHLVEKDEIYAKFYLSQSEKGRWIMLDNSVFELGVAVEYARIIAAANKIKAHCVIAPDVLANGKETCVRSLDFIDFVKKANYPYEVAIVIQGNSFEDWLNCYKCLSIIPEAKRICVNFKLDFEVPNEVKQKTKTQMWFERRIRLFEYLVQNNLIVENKEYHLLGASDCVEFRFLKKYPFITTADTSSPVVHGINNIIYRDYGLPCEKIDKKLDFNAKLALKQIQNITKNIHIVKNFAK